MRSGVIVLLAACYAPHLGSGSPCSEGPCPAGLVCSPASQTCELVAVDAASLADTPVVTHDSAALAPPSNDTAGGAIDISAGGTFTADLTDAHDDAPNNGCGGNGGLDVFYTITLAANEVVYFDTFGSTFATDLRIYPGKACTSIANFSLCNNAACGGAQSQLALQLPAGTSCIVVDQQAAETGTALTLFVKRGGRAGTRLGTGMQTLTGDSCANGTNATNAPATCAPGDDNTAKDLAYYFTVCPSTTSHLDASTCADATQTHFDTVVYFRQAGGASLACEDDDNACAARTERPDNPDGSILRGVPA
ncbi:MAG TPA: hypothetical protein VFQ65_12310, partial [Kofleriaceae bacterium]|nr:hypothetical protein [Kofleriaceae bacterium]